MTARTRYFTIPSGCRYHAHTWRTSVFLQIVNLILDVATGLVGGACLMRLVMQWQRLPFQNPIGRFVFAVTDWMVMPLRRFLPAIGRLDTASLVAAWLMK